MDGGARNPLGARALYLFKNGKDTLFFQRTLVLTGDTELGLTARNLLDRLPWESVPLGLRIALNRGARLARAAREAHRAET